MALKRTPSLIDDGLGRLVEWKTKQIIKICFLGEGVPPFFCYRYFAQGYFYFDNWFLEAFMFVLVTFFDQYEKK
jgi:hypothetical protein